MNKTLLRFVFALMASCSGLFADQIPANPVILPYADALVALKGGSLVPFNSEDFLQSPFIVVYFGAGWCPDCRHFSPSLVAAYNEQPSDARRFEVLLVSQDKTAEGMLKFMKTEKMAWPALTFEKVASAESLKKLYSGAGIPCLTVIDRYGKVVMQSKSDQDAEEVLKELQTLVKKVVLNKG
jgi:thiol-disulfide isomerase/thioredoxin